MNRVYYFEMPVEDMERAIGFYETVFGWNISKHDRSGGPYFSVTTGPEEQPGINGSFFIKEEGWSNLSNVINVEDIDRAIEMIKEMGGEIAFAKCAINGVGYLAYFKDPNGNIFGMMQEDSTVNEEGGM